MKRARVVLALALAVPASFASAAAMETGSRKLPLPDAPVRLVIPDASAFDAALTGSFRQAAVGEIAAEDPVVSSWRQSQVGSKLEAEWSKLSSDLPWSWTQIRRLQPRSLGLALLSAGSLEAVLVIETPLAALPVTPPAGTPKTHGGVSYSLVARGVGDPEGSDERRAGLAWARQQGLLILATSERALLLTLDELAAGRGVTAFLPGLASLELDLDRLRKDRYFVREFVFGSGQDQGLVHAALRLEAGSLVEVREGRGARSGSGFSFDAKAVAAGWEPDADGLARALRAGLLEPSTGLTDRPVAPLTALPPAVGTESDRYLVRLDRPSVQAGAAWEEGDLATWRELLARRPAPGWGWLVDANGGRALVFAWPQKLQADLEKACRATLARRAGRVEDVKVGDSLELRVGPGLPSLAIRRSGDFVWIGSSSATLAALGTPRAAGDLVRWGRVDLAAARGEAERWARAEGPAAPERVRTFSDRVLGLLGWLPAVREISVERRQAEDRWTERIRFESK
jgi:hypothetical protein